MTRIPGPWVVALLCLSLVSCAEQGVKRRSAAIAANAARLKVPSLAPATVSAKSISQTVQQSLDDRVGTTVWDRLRDSFEMADCSGDPEVMRWAKNYTARPRQFEDQLQLALPRLVYVQQIADRHRVAGEFVLLPWVESHFRPVHGRRHQPSGMWQIVPKTAGTLGLNIDSSYDARMDVGASTDAVMSLLRRYQDHFQDWRLTDYAYNAGQFAVRRLLAKHGVPASSPVVPALPVRRVTREHLIKLLAIACVVRDPARFHVRLPTLPIAEHLVAVPIARAMPMAVAAKHAGLPVETLRRYNSGSRDGKLDPRQADSLLLPKSRAGAFLAAQRASASKRVETFTASATSRLNKKQLRSDPPAKLRTHRVRSGETLGEIARHYSIALKQLLHWNDLHGSNVQIGQVLLLHPPR